MAILREQDRKILTDFYGKNFRQYGYDPKSLGWIEGTQEARFAVLTSIGDLSGSSVLDVGCGFAHLYGFLKERDIDVDYTGIDLNEEFIEVAKELYPDARLLVGDFEETKIAGRFDWAFESGIFNLKVKQHQPFVENTLRKMFKMASRGVAADFLSPAQFDFTGEMYHPDPQKMTRYTQPECRSPRYSSLGRAPSRSRRAFPKPRKALRTPTSVSL
jgi:SAM-dependent methyltransferase